jgi:hypothetical protein
MVAEFSSFQFLNWNRILQVWVSELTEPELKQAENWMEPELKQTENEVHKTWTEFDIVSYNHTST